MGETVRDVSVNGVRLRVTEQGEGPLVLLCHGWPELAFSWRKQLPALAEAGFRAVAPDMRGFGASEAPADVSAYTVLHTVGDMVGLVGALGCSQAVIVGHDWGATVAWTAAMLRPDVFTAVAAMSVPHRARGPAAPLSMLRAAGVTRLYWQYFQEPGVAEAEFERDVAHTMRCILAGGFARAEEGALPLTLAEGGGFLDIIRPPEALPAWLAQDELATMIEAYRSSGFRGGLNWYRNIDRNWELTAAWQGCLIRQPALFVAGDRDMTIAGPIGASSLKRMPESVPGLRRSVMLEGAGHWIQQERPEEVNAALIEFLRGL
jgi:pimeloyl-ACP methyl ester carboxylesterase